MFSSQADLIHMSSPHQSDERLNEPCYAPKLNPGPVLWQRKALTGLHINFIAWDKERYAHHLRNILYEKIYLLGRTNILCI